MADKNNEGDQQIEVTVTATWFKQSQKLETDEKDKVSELFGVDLAFFGFKEGEDDKGKFDANFPIVDRKVLSIVNTCKTRLGDANTKGKGFAEYEQVKKIGRCRYVCPNKAVADKLEAYLQKRYKDAIDAVRSHIDSFDGGWDGYTKACNAARGELSDYPHGKLKDFMGSTATTSSSVRLGAW